MFDVETDEQWSEVEGFPLYTISNFGNVQHVDRPNNRRLSLNAQGFPVIVLYKGDVKTRYPKQVNRLVAAAFCPPPSHHSLTTIWHIDGDFENCRWDNLKWERRDRTLEWNEMQRRQKPRYNTPRVLDIRTGVEYDNAYDCAMQNSTIETSVITHIERFDGQYADKARWRYI